MSPQPIWQPKNCRPVNASHSRIRLTHSVIVKAPGQLPMHYLPAELASELGLPARTLYDWLQVGAPHTRDAQGNLWTDGRQFAGWIEANLKLHAVRAKLQDDQAYCLRCKQAVTLIDPHQEQVKGKLILIKGRCPHCIAGINPRGWSDRLFELPAGPGASYAPGRSDADRPGLGGALSLSPAPPVDLGGCATLARNPRDPAHLPGLPEIAERGQRATAARGRHPREAAQGQPALLPLAARTHPRGFGKLSPAWIDTLRLAPGTPAGLREYEYVSEEEVKLLLQSFQMSELKAARLLCAELLSK